MNELIKPYTTFEDDILDRLELEERLSKLETFVKTLSEFDRYVYERRLVDGYSAYDVASMGWNNSVIAVYRAEKRIYYKLKKFFGV